MALMYHDGQPCTGRITESDLARESRSEALIAWFDGWGQSQGMPASTYSRRLDRYELAQWREGWDEGKRATAEWRARCGELEVAG